MRGDNDSRVDLVALRAAEPLDPLVLEHAQELDLDVERQVTNLVEKDRRFVGELEAPDLARQRSGIGAFLPAEQLAFDQRRRDGRAVDADHGAAAAPAQLVHLRGKQLLAGPRLAEEQDRRVGLCDLPHLLVHVANRSALPDDA